MNSKINISGMEEKSNGIEIRQGDIVLIRIFNKQELARILKGKKNDINLAIIGDSITYTIDEDVLYTGKAYSTTGLTKLTIIGICDIEISIKKIHS